MHDKENKPRLTFAREYFFNLGLSFDLEELQEFYQEWQNFDEYAVIQKQTIFHDGNVKKDTFALKCAKRGNDIYFWRLRKRFETLIKNSKGKFLFNPRGNKKTTNTLLVTLTNDTKLSELKDAWETIGFYFNIWITNLRNKYGKISYVRCWESFFNDYPHIHILLIFHGKQFNVFRHDKKFRIEEKEEFEKAYHSFVDVQAVRDLQGGLNYIIKYLTKQYSKFVNPDPETILRKNLSEKTLSFSWIFRKKTFAVSRDLISLLRSSNFRALVQMDLSMNPIKDRVFWVFIGIKSIHDLKNEYPDLYFDESFRFELPYCAWDP